MSTAYTLDDMLPSAESLPAATADREAGRWLVSFLPLDVRGREIGRNLIHAGVPTLIRTLPYAARNDDIDAIDPPLHRIERNLAGDATECILRDYAERGAREIEGLRGHESQRAAEAVFDAFVAILPDPYRFDDASDPDDRLFERRRAHLDARIASAQNPVEEAVARTLLQSNEGAAEYLRANFSALFAELRKKDLHGAQEVGRAAALDAGELRLAKWVGMTPPSRATDEERRTAQATLQLPPEIVALLTERREDQSAALAEEMAELKRQNQELIEAVAALQKPPRNRKN